MSQSIVQPLDCAANTSPFYLLHENIVDPLEGILQEMAATVHSLITRHSTHICRSDGAFTTDRSKAVSSCCSQKMLFLKEHSSIQACGGHNLHETLVSSCHSNYHHAALPCPRQELVHGQLVQDNEAVASTFGFSGGHSQQQECRVQVMTSSIVNQRNKRHEFQTVSDERTSDTFEAFLDEMRKTLKDWSTRHKSLSHAHAKLATKGSSICHVNVDQPAKDQEMGSRCKQQVIKESPYNEQVTKDVRDVVSETSNFQSHTRAEVSSGAAYHTSSLTPDCIDIKHKPKTHAPNKDDKSVSTSTGGYEVAESPEWLPHGWITEVKRRANGTRAGAKVKHYFDPKSKRRFRSRKEVFCFLSTGKAGRYKPRSKTRSMKGDKNEVITSLVQASRPRQLLPRMPIFVPYYSFSSMPSSEPLAYPPSGFFNGLSLPFQYPEGQSCEQRLNFGSRSAEIDKRFAELHPKGSDVCFSRSNMPRNPFDSDEPNSSKQGLQNGIKGHLAQGTFSVHNTNTDGQIWQHQPSALTCFKRASSCSASKEALKMVKDNNVDANGKFIGKSGTFRCGLAPAKFKRSKPEGKGALEVLGRLICQQGLSKLRQSKN